MNSWDWWIHSDSGLLARILIGVAIFIILAMIDLAPHGRGATRWREYLFLLFASLVALLYGLLNDLITATISWEYFYYGKGLESRLGPVSSLNTRALLFEAAKIGMKSSWTVGLILGAFLLIANNPRKNRPQLAYKSLTKILVATLLTTAATSTILGAIGYFHGLPLLSRYAAELAPLEGFRPRNFVCVWGIHIGAYAGAVIATIASIVYVIRIRCRG